nr:LacI family DNA-binding transcriptional regulator [Roseomonas acroporae]
MPPASRVTLNHVAEAAGVSRATASLVLRGSSLVAETTRARVQEAVSALGYVYNRGAAMLRARRSHTIGLLVTDLTNPFFAELAMGVQETLDAAGSVAFLASTGEDAARQERFLRRMREQNVDGVVLCPATGTPPALVARLREEWRLPCVQALRHVGVADGAHANAPAGALPGGDYAGADYERGIDQATEHLIRLGHRRIAMIGGALRHSATRERHAGFLAALRRHGLPGDLVLRVPLTRRDGAEAVAALLDRADAPTAAVCFNDIVAFGAMLGLESRGLRAGEGFAVIGVDDVPEAPLSRPPLTTVATHPREVGEVAARLLLRRIDDPARPRESVVLPTHLVIRGSCGAPPGGAPSGAPGRDGTLGAALEDAEPR